MTTKIMLDKAVRVKIPKLRRSKVVLKKERGVWVFQGEPTDISVTTAIDTVRGNRLHELSRRG